MREFGDKVYARYLVSELIQRIKSDPETQNPLITVHKFICWIDEIRLNRGNPISNQFIGNVICIADCIEQYLWENEKIKEESNV